MSSPDQQVGPYLGGTKNFAKSLKKRNPKGALGLLKSAGVGKNPPRGVRIKTKSPTSSQSSQYGSEYSGNVVFGGVKGMRGIVNKRTGMVWSPNTQSWVPSPGPSMSDRIKTAIESTAESLFRPFKPRQSKKKSMARSIQAALSYDPTFGKKVRNLQKTINTLEDELKAANKIGRQNLVTNRRRKIKKSTTEIIDLVNAESKRLSNVYKNLGINFNTTPKKDLVENRSALKRMINKIMGTTPDVSFTKKRGPSTKTLGGIASASARRYQSRLPNYKNLPGTGSATAARAVANRTGPPIILGPP